MTVVFPRIRSWVDLPLRMPNLRNHARSPWVALTATSISGVVAIMPLLIVETAPNLRPHRGFTVAASYHTNSCLVNRYCDTGNRYS
jgi:hypothetical protein